MAELKTKPNKKSVEKFLNEVSNEQKRKDSFEILKLMEKVTKLKPEMWGDSLVGFGKYHYKYKSGREGEWFTTGFSPRKQNLTLYIMSGLKNYEDLLKKLGRYKTSKGCLYINKLEDINLNVLKEILTKSTKKLA